MHFIDRRLNPQDKSLTNRQRFIRRAKGQIKEAMEQSLKQRTIADPKSGDKIAIPAKSIQEPRFRLSGQGGQREIVAPGNKEFVEGDRLPRPRGGGGGGGRQAQDSGEGEDEFVFTLTEDEFLELFFEDLELPDLIKTQLKEETAFKHSRAGYSVNGSPANLSVVRTMRNSLARRIALRRPKREEIEAAEKRLAELEAEPHPTSSELAEIETLREKLKVWSRRVKAVPYIDPIDVRYNRFDITPHPNTQAVMFCLMDVSGSMDERAKDLAKRFFMLLHMFLKRRYDHVAVVFIRHTHEAKEVDEQTFFYSRESGGTVVSTALEEMRKVLAARFPLDEWNIYAAQASDGENFDNDSERCLQLLSEELLPKSQYYAYIEIGDTREADLLRDEDSGGQLWRTYRTLLEDWPNFAMKRIFSPADIYPVFRQLFAKQQARAR